MAGIAALSWLATGVVVLGDGRAAVALTANEPALAQQWGMQKIGAPTAWGKGMTGAGITIGVVDSGVDLAHEDLAAKVVTGTNLVSPGTPPQDDFGHGTHVAGIAAAITGNGRGVTGVAPDAAILPVKVLDDQGRGAANIDDGIRWAVDHGAQVVNVSIGDLLEPVDGPPFTEAIRYAWSKGVICVASAGNSFVFNSSFDQEPVVVVSATTPTDTAATYSNGVGSAKWGMAAPGGAGGMNEADDILSTYWVQGESNQYGYLSGTSMAAPHVAGAAAVLRGLGLTPQQTVDQLLATAKDLGTPGRDNTYGAGRLDLAKAVEGLSAPAGGGGTSGGSGGASGTGAGGTGAGGGTGASGGTSGGGAGGTSGAGGGGRTTSTARRSGSTASNTAGAGAGTGGDAGAAAGGASAGVDGLGAGSSSAAGTDAGASGATRGEEAAGGRGGRLADDNGGGSGGGGDDVPIALVLAAVALVVGSGSLVPMFIVRRRRDQGGRATPPTG
jgi:subtilisin family serine protease